MALSKSALSDLLDALRAGFTEPALAGLVIRKGTPCSRVPPRSTTLGHTSTPLITPPWSAVGAVECKPLRPAATLHNERHSNSEASIGAVRSE
jgi:hypothetical protein